jgi:hypothetical protein
MYDMLLSCGFYEKEINKLCFQGACWTNVEKLLGGCAGLIRKIGSFKTRKRRLQGWKRWHRSWKEEVQGCPGCHGV